MDGVEVDALPGKPGYVRLTITEQNASLARDLSLEDAGNLAALLNLMAAQARRLLRDAARSQA